MHQSASPSSTEQCLTDRRKLRNRRSLLPLLVPLLLLILSGFGREQAGGTTWKGADGTRSLELESVVEALKGGVASQWRPVGQGINDTRRVLVTNGDVQIHAIFRSVREERRGIRLPSGRQLELRDDFVFEVAAYRVDQMLNLGRVPPTILRGFDGEEGSLQLWMENSVTEEKRRQRASEDLPDLELQWQLMVLFDNLIYNDDRHQGNYLYDPQGRLWMIDHTRAFRPFKELPYRASLERCERSIWVSLKALDDLRLSNALKELLRPEEVTALAARRDLLIEHFEELIEENGEDEVLY